MSAAGSAWSRSDNDASCKAAAIRRWIPRVRPRWLPEVEAALIDQQRLAFGQFQLEQRRVDFYQLTLNS